jgi:Tol biopolymer transport system component
MLSASIGLSTAGYRLGKGIPDRCVPQMLLPRTMYFNRHGTTPGQAAEGSVLGIRAALDSTVTVVGDSADALKYYFWRPRVSPDGSTVLFVCLNSSYYPNICRANADGSNVVRLTTGTAYETSPDWSPDGSQIVFVRGLSQIYVMNADGGSQTIIPSSPTGVTSVAWQPVPGSRRVAYTIGSYGAVAGVHRRSLDTATTDSIVVGYPTCCISYDARLVDWSPAGDSLVFDVYQSGQRVITVAPNVVGATPRVGLSLTTLTGDPAWTDQGILFVAYRGAPSRYRMFLLRPDDTIGRIGRDDRDNSAPGMLRQ